MFLKNVNTGVVFAHTPLLAGRPDMRPCDVSGRVIVPEVVEKKEPKKTVEAKPLVAPDPFEASVDGAVETVVSAPIKPVKSKKPIE